MNRTITFTILLFALLSLGVWWITRAPDSEIQASISPAEALSGDTEGYLRADGPINFSFPEDHGPHPGFRTEWWYYTGNLEAEDGRRFGYQFTIFRNQVAPPDTIPEERDSDWGTNQLYMAHFAVADIENEQNYHEERFSRGGAGLAGAQSPPFRIWLEDWSAQYSGDDEDGATPMRISAEMENAGINLKLTPVKPLVLQGDRGYDPKGPEPGNASYYVSFTRLATEGSITINGQDFEVEGQSWMDHEWSTSALTEDQEGWDWFSIQLSNGYDLMFYQLRETDGSLSPYTSGTVVDPDGNTISLHHGDVNLEVLEHWTSTVTGVVYPVAWRLEVPSVDMELHMRTYFPAQEMDVSFRYYEGAIEITGKHDDEEIRGDGYVEMTGYGQ